MWLSWCADCPHECLPVFIVPFLRKDEMTTLGSAVRALLGVLASSCASPMQAKARCPLGPVLNAEATRTPGVLDVLPLAGCGCTRWRVICLNTLSRPCHPGGDQICRSGEASGRLPQPWQTRFALLMHRRTLTNQTSPKRQKNTFTERHNILESACSQAACTSGLQFWDQPT